MGKFAPGTRIGLRDWVTMKVIAVYPYESQGSDEDTEKAVRDWFYEQDCDAEDQMAASFVDALSDEEAASLPDGLIGSDETNNDSRKPETDPAIDTGIANPS